MSLGEQLQLLRRGHNLTQEQFAEQLKVSRQAVSKWESSKGYPEIEKIIYICNQYGVTMDELFSEEVPIRGKEQTEEAQLPAAERTLKSPKLLHSFTNFFTNLTPANQTVFTSIFALFVLGALILVSTFMTKGETNQDVMEYIWLGLLLLFGVGEAITVGLTSIWFAAGALAALICSMAGGNTALQIILFFVVSALSIAAFRPIAQKHINNKIEPTNADSIVGREVLVTEKISNLQSMGAVYVGGLTWSARSADNSEIAIGTLVRILRIEGVKVFVETIKEET
jgi:membrane protein implicated in regulation of membrane protease activity/transcriptional regulator with XRE-family HTH domain